VGATDEFGEHGSSYPWPFARTEPTYARSGRRPGWPTSRDD